MPLSSSDKGVFKSSARSLSALVLFLEDVFFEALVSAAFSSVFVSAFLEADFLAGAF